MAEDPKRLAPKGDVLRELFLKSGNLCAFPGCTHLMMDADGNFIGEVCHVEAAETGGQRFNAAMSNEDRRRFENLLLMCHGHHVVTNDVAKYPVEKLRQIKADHEARFSDPQRAITATLKDWTTLDRAEPVKNLKKLAAVLGWELEDKELADVVRDVNRLLEKLRLAPRDVREFARVIAERAHRIRKTDAVRDLSNDGVAVAVEDVESALRLTPDDVNRYGRQLEHYNLGCVDEVSWGETEAWAVCLKGLNTGWPVWSDLALFCEKSATPLSVLVVDLDFSRLDD